MLAAWLWLLICFNVIKKRVNAFNNKLFSRSSIEKNPYKFIARRSMVSCLPKDNIHSYFTHSTVALSFQNIKDCLIISNFSSAVPSTEVPPDMLNMLCKRVLMVRGLGTAVKPRTATIS